jgi:hypothetical protein
MGSEQKDLVRIPISDIKSILVGRCAEESIPCAHDVEVQLKNTAVYKTRWSATKIIQVAKAAGVALAADVRKHLQPTSRRMGFTKPEDHVVFKWSERVVEGKLKPSVGLSDKDRRALVRQITETEAELKALQARLAEADSGFARAE